MFARVKVGRRHLALDQLRQPGDSLVQLRTRLGDHHHRVIAVDEAKVGKPVVTNTDALPVHVIKAGDRRIRQQHVRPLDDDQQVFLEKLRFALLGSRAEAHLPHQLEGERRVADCLLE